MMQRRDDIICLIFLLHNYQVRLGSKCQFTMVCERVKSWWGLIYSNNKPTPIWRSTQSNNTINKKVYLVERHIHSIKFILRNIYFYLLDKIWYWYGGTKFFTDYIHFLIHILKCINCVCVCVLFVNISCAIRYFTSCSFSFYF